jgi:DNA uptake protein ComE-like DNA-binding protein
MARKKKGDEGGSALTTAAEVAAAAVGIAATAYKAVQAYREDGGANQPGEARRVTPSRRKAPVPATLAADAKEGHAFVTDTPPANDDGMSRDAAPGTPALSAGTGRTLDIAGVVAAAGGVAKALLDLNTAPRDALMTLRKIGRKRAKRIVAHRPFARVKDLKRVLPKRVYKAIKHQLTV